MGIANYKPDINVKTDKNTPKVEPSNYTSIINDDNQFPLLSILSYIKGSPWNVNYYSQYISKHNDIREIDVSQPNVYQQYQLINNLELRVLQPLQDSYNSDTAITSLTGSSNFYPYIIPNINDYFITDVGDMEQGIFRITNVERKSFNHDSVYEIEYNLVGYVSQSQELYNNLNDKVIKKYYFIKDRLLENLQPLLKEEDYQQVTDLYSLYSSIVNYYFNNFMSNRYHTLVLPGQPNSVYDPFLVDFILKIVETTDNDKIRNLKSLPLDNDVFFQQPQLFSLLADKDYYSVPVCNKEMGYISRLNFNANSTLRSVYFSYIDYFVYPITVDNSLLVSGSPDAKEALTEYDFVETVNSAGINYIEENDIYTSDSLTTPYIYKVHKDNKYILSNNFYNDTSQKSILEILVKDYLKNQTINNSMLISLCNKFKLWNRLDQFYYGPILLLLIKQSNKNTYT